MVLFRSSVILKPFSHGAPLQIERFCQMSDVIVYRVSPVVVEKVLQNKHLIGLKLLSPLVVGAGHPKVFGKWIHVVAKHPFELFVKLLDQPDSGGAELSGADAAVAKPKPTPERSSLIHASAETVGGMADVLV